MPDLLVTKTDNTNSFCITCTIMRVELDAQGDELRLLHEYIQQ